MSEPQSTPCPKCGSLRRESGLATESEKGVWGRAPVRSEFTAEIAIAFK